MAIGIKSSFAAGELDPALTERTNLDKYDAGLKTARNVIIGKTGRVLSRAGRRLLFQTRFDDKPVRIHAINASMFFEFGVGYIKLYTVDQSGPSATVSVYETVTHSYNETDIPNVQFVNHFAPASLVSGLFPVVLIFCAGKATQLYWPQTATAPYVPFSTISPPSISTPPVFVSNTVGGTAYDVSYAATVVRDGIESFPTITDTGKLQALAGELNTLIFSVDTASAANKVTELRVYRRPRSGGAFGYVGSSTTQTTSGGLYRYTFVDFGQAADYTHTPPTYSPTIVENALTGPEQFLSATGTIYQQRLVMSSKIGIETSRIGHQYTFTRDYPYTSDSALSFSGSTKGIDVLWITESNGLVVFMSDGVYVSSGSLVPSNLALDKKGNWVIDSRVPPISIPGGVLFVDRATNTVRELRFSLENGSYVGDEVSIFSNHLFENQRIVSWAFQDGPFPLLWVVFNTGTCASFTYEKDHQMRAWTRHDSSQVGVESVTTLRGQDAITDAAILFVTKKGTKRYVEMSLRRYELAERIQADPESDKWESIAAMDSVVSWKNLLSQDKTKGTDLLASLSGADHFNLSAGGTSPLTLTCGTSAVFTSPGPGAVGTTLVYTSPTLGLIYFTVTARASSNSITVQPINVSFPPSEITALANLAVSYDNTIVITPVTPNTWDGYLNITCNVGGVFTSPGPGAVGSVLRWFNPVDRTVVDLEVVARTDNNNIEVLPNTLFPSEYASGARLYQTKTVFTGLDHMEGEDVAVIADGYVISSPNNNIDDYPTLTVTSGQITLPATIRGALVHVGRPYAMDVETLDMSTVEQRPIMIESKSLNKLYVKIYRTRGLFIGSMFPDDDKVQGTDVTATNMVKLDGFDAYDVNYELQDPIFGNRYDQPVSKRVEVTLPGDWKSQGRVCLRQVDPLHFEILSIIPDIDDQRRG